MTQIDLIREQVEAAARGATQRATAQIRQNSSLVNQIGFLTRNRRPAPGTPERSFSASASAWLETVQGPVQPGKPHEAPPAADGYVRKSPVQPVYEAVGYRKKILLRGIGIAVLLAALCICIPLLGRLGIWGR